jgi:uncharacterized protein DUF4266
MRLRASGAIALCAALFAGGCVDVPAYQRGYLASPAMAVEDQPSARAFEKVHSAKEAASGGASVGGGGCGCN